jgi:hypothetical protein
MRVVLSGDVKAIAGMADVVGLRGPTSARAAMTGPARRPGAG